MALSRKAKDSVIRIAFLVTALSSIVALGLIMLYLFLEGLPIFQHVSVTDFLFGHLWYPTSDPADFGIFPLIVASVAVTLASSALAIPLGVMTAIYLAEIAGPKTRGFFKPVVELLAALPSVAVSLLPEALRRVSADYPGIVLRVFDLPSVCEIARANIR